MSRHKWSRDECWGWQRAIHSQCIPTAEGDAGTLCIRKLWSFTGQTGDKNRALAFTDPQCTMERQLHILKITHLKINNWRGTTPHYYKICANPMFSQNRTKTSTSRNNLSFLDVSGQNPLQVKPTTSPALSSGWWMMAALKTCMRWEVDHVYFGILVVTHDAWLKGSGFTVCVFSALFTSWPSAESCPEMPPEALSGSHGPSREAPPSVVVCKKGLWELVCWFMEIPHCLR